MSPKRSYGPYSFTSSHEERVLFPDIGLTKGQLIDYYERVAEFLLPHARDRPLTLRRFPEGIGKEGFYQQAAGDYFPDFIERVTVEKEGGSVDHVVVSRMADLAYLANQGVVVLHGWLSKKDKPRRPDLVVFDLDPPRGGEFAAVIQAARNVAGLLREVGLTPFVKTSGSKGLHVAAPIRRGPDFDEARAFARSASELLVARNPDAYTLEQRRNKRRGRIYLDVLRNSYAHTSVLAYSVRALPGAPVSTPLAWDELGDASLTSRSYTVKNLFRRLGQTGDPWSGMGRRAAGLAPAARSLAGLAGEK